MRTLKLTVAYDGTDFCGWQIQSAGRSVQQTLELAFKSVTSETLRMTASGRTDAGVHALAQVVSCTSSSKLTCEVLHQAINANLPEDVRVLGVEQVSADFHPIRDARSKRYRYVIQNGGVPAVFRRRYCWHVHRPLDVEMMRQAALELRGEHDFASFQSAGSPRKTTVRHVSELTVNTHTDDSIDWITIEIQADGFLYNMARNIVGTLVEVGSGKQPPNWPTMVLRTRDRGQAGMTVPAQGLFLVNVCYDKPQSSRSTVHPRAPQGKTSQKC